MSRRGSEKRESFGVVRTLILLAALCVFAYSAYQLYTIFHGYHAANKEYETLANDFTKPADPDKPSVTESKAADTQEQLPETEPEQVTTETGKKVEMPVEDAAAPLEVNWSELKAANSEIIGWLYVDALPNISYPICQAADNDFYLHRTFQKQYLFAGSIFADYHNTADFADPNTLIYGHNMKNGSMFGMLKTLKEQAKYDAAPYFWILTENGNYRYHIIAVFDTLVDSDVYMLYSDNGSDFLEWEKSMQAQSAVKNEVPLFEEDKAVILSTCTGNDAVRCVVIGKCVSSTRPVRKPGTFSKLKKSTNINRETDEDSGAESTEGGSEETAE